MSSELKLEQAYKLLKDNQINEARKLLKELLSELPFNAGVSALLAYSSTDELEMKLHLREVLAHTRDSELAVWASQLMHAPQVSRSVQERSLPPLTWAERGDQPVLATGEANPEPLPQAELPPHQFQTLPVEVPPSLDSRLKRRDLFGMSLTKLGMWVTLIGGLVLVSTIYVPPVTRFVIVTGFPVLLCTLLLVAIGGSLIVVGLVRDRKKRPKYH